MGNKAKREYLKKIKRRYQKACKKEKKRILDEFCEVCGYNRKYAIRLLNQVQNRPRKRPGPSPRYPSKEVLAPLKRIWFACDQICSKRLVAAIPEWLSFYDEEYEPLPADTKQKLLTLSPATIDRLLKSVRVSQKPKGLCGTKPGGLLKNLIPIKPFDIEITKPGMIEADTVAHCGGSLEGNFAWSVTLTDVYSGWTENRGTWNKGSHGVLEQIKDVENSLVFPILNFTTDNGSEFLNYHLYDYFKEKSPPINFNRTRPYHKDDNARVEEKNWTHVRQLFGYERFANPDIIDPMNELYKLWSLYQNHFCPTLKLKEKTRVNSKIKKRHGKALTPYLRLLQCADVSEKGKRELKKSHEKVNPFKLKKRIEKRLKDFFNLLQSEGK